jgi:hypothetical protein
MHLEPAAIDREFEARAVLGRAAPVTEQERLVDLLDVDAALNRLDRIGDLEDPVRGFFWVGIRAGGRRISCGGLVFLVTTSCDDPDHIIEQWPLQRLRVIPRRASFGAGKSAVS